jgi:uncharacterized Tic20 family protein
MSGESKEPAMSQPHVPIRPSTVERENVIALLGMALAEGRIDGYEFSERAAAAFQARSDADLGRLLLDLPAPPIAVPEPIPQKPRRGWAVCAHLLGLATLFLGPLAISRSRHGRFAREHALEAANFQLTYLLSCIAVPVAAIFTLGVGLLLWIPLILGWLWFSCAGAISAARGREFRYPLNLRLIKE